MKLVFLMFFTGVLTSVALGAVTDGNRCPETFTGQVKAILEESGPERAFAKNQVIFSDGQIVSVLKNGPYQLQKGSVYRVELRDGKLCDVVEI